MKTRLSEHGVTEERIEDVIRNLDQHGMKNFSETGDQTLYVTRMILRKALYVEAP